MAVNKIAGTGLTLRSYSVCVCATHEGQVLQNDTVVHYFAQSAVFFYTASYRCNYLKR